MQVPAPIQARIREELKFEISGFHPASGGCINQGGRFETSQGYSFIKWNDARSFPGMFEAEASGLKILSAANCIDIPDVIFQGEAGPYQFLLLEYIQPGSRKRVFWENLGSQLAKLHSNSHNQFGLDHDNYIGSLRQRNPFKKSWIDFFISGRLEVQLDLAEGKGLIDKALRNQFQSLYKKLPDLLPSEKPSLLHGDLWSGNLMVNEKGEPCLIDPAVYYGHREAELAFTQLFGGFEEEFYKSYDESFPLQPGFYRRADIYNLYPLLVHANLFGTTYIIQVKSILQRFN